ncbi:hypothetical protein T07_2898 [Trichinella nelsoni]|uniref:Uncharacterized protein n=1 Tax=Trichinella nelsoni TaxID=6336 RepID=A0A0V0RZC8_9BILA|nr:hypothetical protein T07_2898 [Trichinella nelsoni]
MNDNVNLVDSNSIMGNNTLCSSNDNNTLPRKLYEKWCTLHRSGYDYLLLHSYPITAKPSRFFKILSSPLLFCIRSVNEADIKKATFAVSNIHTA